MRNIQHLFALLTLTLLMPLATKASTESELIVRLSSGDSLTSLMSTRPVISFSNNHLVVNEMSTGTLRIDQQLSAVKQIVIAPKLAGGSSHSGGNTDVLPVCAQVGYHVNYGLEPVYIPAEEPVEATDIASATITIENTSYPYTGSTVEPTISVVYGATTLVKGTDYTVSYSNNLEPGTATVTVMGIGNYTGTASSTFTIVRQRTIDVVINGERYTPKDPDAATALYQTEYGIIGVMNCYALPGETTTIYVIPQNNYRISKDNITPTLTGNDPANLKAQRTYTLTMPATGTVTIEATFTQSADFSEAVLALATETAYTYTGEAIRPACKVTLDGDELVAGTDYSLEYSNNVAVGEATITATGKGTFTGTLTKTFSIVKAPLTVKADDQRKVYGEALPELTYQITGFVNNENETALTTLPVAATEATAQSKVGEYAITVSGAEADNYSFTYTNATLTVVGIDLSNTTIAIANEADLVYTGQAVEPTYTVQHGDTALIEGTDFEAVLSNHTNAGTATLTITGINNHQGTQSKTFDIQKAMLTVTAEDKSKAYGEAVPELTATITGFVNDEDATVLTKQPVVKTDCTQDSHVGEYTISADGAEAQNYQFTYIGAKLTVTEADLSNAEVSIANEEKLVYSGQPISPSFTVQYGSATLTEGTDYAATLSDDHTNAGIVTLTITGKNNYKGTLTKTFNIQKAQLTATAAAQTKVYGDENPELTATITGYVNGEDASAITTMPVVTTDCKAESAVGDYIISVSGGEAQNYEFTYVPATLTVTSRSLANATLTLTSDSVAYTGQSVLPEFTVRCGSATLIEGTDYDVTPANNTEPGTATLTVTGKGNYDGQIETTFTIYLKPTVEVVINDMAVKPVLDENDEKHRAEFVTDNGKVIVSDYYALPGDMVVLTIVPTDDWLLGEESILVSVPVEVQLSQQSYYVGTYSVPENGMVSISVLFQDREVVGINDYAGTLRFEVIDGKTVRVLGAPETAPVSVFDARGQQVAAEVVRSDRELIVRLANQPQGLYIIKVNNNTFKVYRK